MLILIVSSVYVVYILYIIYKCVYTERMRFYKPDRSRILIKGIVGQLLALLMIQYVRVLRSFLYKSKYNIDISYNNGR